MDFFNQETSPSIQYSKGKLLVYGHNKVVGIDRNGDGDLDQEFPHPKSYTNGIPLEKIYDAVR